MALTLTTSGLIAQETFDAMDVDAQPPGWTLKPGNVSRTYKVQPAGTGMSVRMLTSEQEGTSDGDSSLVRDVPASQLDAVVQAKIRINPGGLGGDNARPGLTLRYATNGAFVRAWASHWPLDTPEGLWLRSRQSVMQTTNVALGLTEGTVYTLQLSAIALEARARLFSPAGVLLATASLSNINRVDPGLAGVYDILDHREGCTYDDWRLFSHTVVQVVGLPAGWKMRIGATTEVEDGSGTAEIDLAGSIFPVGSTVEVLDAIDTVQESVTPSGGIWGGDVYTFDGVISSPGRVKRRSRPSLQSGKLGKMPPPKLENLLDAERHMQDMANRINRLIEDYNDRQ